MIAVVWGILKILAWILLGAVGLLLLLVMLILLVPVRYRAEGSYYGRPEGKAGTSWFLHLIDVSAGYHEAFDFRIRLFGFQIFPKKEKKTDSGKKSPRLKKKRRKRKKMPDDRGNITAEVRTDSLKTPAARPEKETVGSAQTDAKAKPSADSPEPEEKASRNEKRPFPFAEFYDKLKNILLRLPKTVRDRIRRIVSSVAGKYRVIRDKRQWICDFLSEEENLKTLKLLKRQAFRAIRHIFPQKIHGKIRFGFDDPYTTGQILTWISPFYGLYAGKLELIPVFEEKSLDGELALKGRIRPGTLIVIGVRIFLNKNFRRLFRELRNRD